MSKSRRVWVRAAIGVGLAAAAAGCEAAAPGREGELGGDDVAAVSRPLGSSSTAAINSAGFADTVHASGSLDRSNPFFQVLGTNPRTCETCHATNQGWAITADASTLLFLTSHGLDPLFMVHDAGSRPGADISTLAARLATFGPTLLARGLIRFTRNINPAAEFAVTAVSDPSGFSTLTQVLAFRRPTPTANEAKVSSTGWNGGGTTVPVAIANTAAGAARLHGQRVDPLPPESVNAIRDFQLGVFFAQTFDFLAGPLDAGGARGGPTHLMAEPFYVGINDIQDLDPAGPFDPGVFDLFDDWADDHHSLPFGPARAAIYRGQEIFNHLQFDISGVAGLNDLLGQATVRGTCSTCHNSPNVGGHSVFRVFDVGTADPPRCAPVLPLLTLENRATGAVRRVCDLGRAGNSGRWVDVGAFRAPPLRGLAARAPYFHDGQARDLRAVVDYFDHRFGIGLTVAQKRDLIAFLRAL